MKPLIRLKKVQDIQLTDTSIEVCLKPGFKFSFDPFANIHCDFFENAKEAREAINEAVECSCEECKNLLHGAVIQEEIWAKELLLEFETINRVYGTRLPVPVINFMDSDTLNGQWASDICTLSLSRQLLTNQPWEIVIEVLKHEMAHQYVSYYFEDHDDQVHGENFKLACEKLGVHPVFQKATSNLRVDAKIFHDDMAHKSKNVVRKVEKLLSLARSDSENEARAASDKANYLLHKHNLSRVDLLDEKQIGYRSLCHKKKKIEDFSKKIALILQDFYYVHIITCDTFDTETLERYRQVLMIGKTESLDIAEHVYWYLYNTGHKIWQLHRQKNDYQSKDKNSFLRGFVAGVRANLKKQFKNLKENSEYEFNLPAITLDNLMCQSENLNKKMMRKKFPYINRPKTKYKHFSWDAYDTGKDVGKKTIIRKGIKTNSNFGGYLNMGDEE